MSVTLYVDSTYTSPYALSVYVALQEKAIPFTLKVIDLQKQEHLDATYLEHFPIGKIPGLRHHGFFLTESSAIDEYLDEVFPAPHYQALYPRDIQARALARQLQAWLLSDLAAIRTERPTTVIFNAPLLISLSSRAKQEAERLCRVADALLPLYAKNLFGEWCIADTELSLMLNRLIMNGDAVPERLRSYALLQWQRPSIQNWVALSKV